MKKEQKTIALSGRRYGLGLYNKNTDTFIFIPPSSALQADAQLMNPKNLEKIINENFECWASSRGPLFKRKRKSTVEPWYEDHAKAVRNAVKDKHEGIVKFWERDHDDISAIAKPGYLSGTIPGKHWGEKYNVSIHGYRTSQQPLRKIEGGGCKESHFSSLKRGPTHFGHMCSHAFTLMRYADRNREKVRNLRTILRKGGEIFKPVMDFDDKAVAFFLMDYYLLERKLFEIDRALVKRHGIKLYDRYYQEMFNTGENNIGFYVLVNRNIFSEDDRDFVPNVLKGHFDIFAKRIYQRGYRHNGFVIEFQGTPFETIAAEFIHPDRRKSRRLRFACWDNHPPLTVTRKPLVKERERSIYPGDFNPFMHLEEQNFIVEDDCTGENSRAVIEIPSGRAYDFKDDYINEIPKEIKSPFLQRIIRNEPKYRFYLNLLNR